MATEEVVHADPNDVGLYELESLCMNCEEDVSNFLCTVISILTEIGCHSDIAHQDPLFQRDTTGILQLRPLPCIEQHC